MGDLVLRTDLQYTKSHEIKAGVYTHDTLLYEGDIDGDGDNDIFYVPMTIRDSKITELGLKNAEVKLTTTGAQRTVELKSNESIDKWSSTVYVDGQAMKAPKLLQVVAGTLGRQTNPD